MAESCACWSQASEALNITLAHHPQERQPECIGHLHPRTGNQHTFDKRLFLGFQFR